MDNLNMELRSRVISELLIIEKKTKDLLQLIFRIFEHNTKTLGNSSNSISLKTKIDFLFDLKDLTNDDYNGFKKLMEIRNQFAHNAEANSFAQLEKFNPDLNIYLKKKFPDLFKSSEDIEEIYLNAFIKLAEYSILKLDNLRLAYQSGFNAEIKVKFTHRAINNGLDILKLAYKSFNSNNIDKIEFEKHFDELAENLKIALYKDSLIEYVTVNPRIKKELNNRKL